MKSKKYLIFISFIIFTLTNISNSNSIEPDIFVQSTVNRASQVLSDNLTKDNLDKSKFYWIKDLSDKCEKIELKGSIILIMLIVNTIIY